MDTGITNDPKIMRLSHPLRGQATLANFLPVYEEVLGSKTWNALCAALREPGAMTCAAVPSVANLPQHRGLQEFVMEVSRSGGGTEMGAAFAAFMLIRQLLVPQPYFVLADALVTLLEHTDIADDVPVSALKLPFPRCYVEFGQSRNATLILPHDTSGDHILEGAYCEEGVHPERGPCIYVMLTGSPIGKSNAMDDATFAMEISTVNPDRPIREVLVEKFEHSRRLARESGLRPSTEAHFNANFENLLFLVKALLYIGLPGIRKELHAEKANAEKALKAKKSGAKQAKLHRKLSHLTDYVLVQPPSAGGTTRGDAATAGNSVKAHWRRGHYRMQAYGVGLALRKVIFIEPVLVNATNSETLTSPSYRVR